MLLALFGNLLLAHVVGDFYLQWNKLCMDKVEKGFKGYGLWLHAFIIGVLALKPANILILKILNACKVNTRTSDEDHGNFHSGELIGWLERGLMLIFVVMGQYEAIGFLIAGKSILRFGEASRGDEKSEYVLTGTLLSLAVAMCLGILVRWVAVVIVE